MILQFIYYVVLSVVTIVVAWWLYFTSTRFYKLCIKIPGPTPIPVIGNIELIINRKVMAHKILEVFQKHSPICKVFLGSKCLVGILDADDIFKVLSSRETLSKFSFYTPVKLGLGTNIVTADRDVWRRYRRILNPGFNTNLIRNYTDVFNGKSKNLVAFLKDKQNEEKFDMYDILLMTTLDIITETSAGINLGVLENNRIELPSSFKRGKKIMQECGLSPLHWIEIVYKYSKYNKEVTELLKLDRQFLEPIKEKYITHDSNDSMENVSEQNDSRIFDYVFRYLKSNRNENFTDVELIDQIRMLGCAGSETTAFTTSVCLMLLGLHQDVQDKVVEELHGIFGNDIYRPALYEDLQRMTYTEQVIKETMRLFPPAFLTGRRVDEEIEVGGYILPVGTDVVISPFLLHRDPKYFPDPLKFDPDRFTPENVRSRSPHCFIPFFTGPRNCIGHYYAMVQMKTVLSHLLRHFEFIPCGTRVEMEELSMEFLLALKNGYNVKMKQRQEIK